MEQTKAASVQNMYDRHVAAAETMASSVEKSMRIALSIKAFRTSLMTSTDF